MTCAMCHLIFQKLIHSIKIIWSFNNFLKYGLQFFAFIVGLLCSVFNYRLQCFGIKIWFQWLVLTCCFSVWYLMSYLEFLVFKWCLHYFAFSVGLQCLIFKCGLQHLVFKFGFSIWFLNVVSVFGIKMWFQCLVFKCRIHCLAFSVGLCLIFKCDLQQLVFKFGFSVWSLNVVSVFGI